LLQVYGEHREQRWGTTFRPGQSRACDVEIPRDSRLFFALRLLEGTPGFGQLRFTVRLDGELVFERRTVARPRPHWWHVSATFDAQPGAPRVLSQPRPHWWEISMALPPGDGLRHLEFRAEHVRRSGEPFPAEPGSLAWIALGSPRLDVPTAARPRRVLIWVSQDTVRADHLSVLGYGRSTAPELEALASGWMIFERAMAPASWTLPSVLSQFMARYPSFHGGGRARRARNPDADHLSVFEVLAGEGFTVLGVTANEFISHRFHSASGFDTLWQDIKQQADTTNELALQAVDEWGGGDLALFVHYMDPHSPYSPPPPYDALFTDPDYPRNAEQWVFNDFDQFDHTEADVRQLEGLYDGELAYTDAAIADLLRRLAERGLLEDSVLVYSADHGEEFQDHGGWGHGRNLHEEVQHVPLALRIPGVEPRRIETPVSLVDLAPTLLDALQIEAPSSFEGRSLLPLMRGEAWPEGPVFSETERTPDGSHHISVRRGNLKYIAVTQAGSGHPTKLVAEALYDLDADPEERRPLESGPELIPFRREVLDFLDRAHKEVQLGPAIELSRDEEERLRALGYLQ